MNPIDTNLGSISTAPLPTQQANINSSDQNLSVIFSQIAEKIIEQQEQIIGPVAVEQASQIPELDVDWATHHVSINGDATSVIDKLVQQYKDLFGQISVDVCKEAASQLLQSLNPEQLPESLK